MDAGKEEEEEEEEDGRTKGLVLDKPTSKDGATHGEDEMLALDEGLFVWRGEGEIRWEEGRVGVGEWVGGDGPGQWPGSWPRARPGCRRGAGCGSRQG